MVYIRIKSYKVKSVLSVLTYDKMCNDAGEYEHTEKSQRYNEEVEIPVISFAYAVTDPWAVMVKPLCKIFQSQVNFVRRRLIFFFFWSDRDFSAFLGCKILINFSFQL